MNFLGHLGLKQLVSMRAGGKSAGRKLLKYFLMLYTNESFLRIAVVSSTRVVRSQTLVSPSFLYRNMLYDTILFTSFAKFHSIVSQGKIEANSSANIRMLPTAL